MKNRILSLMISKIAIIKKNRIVFMSYNGHFNDNPKQIFLEMHRVNSKLDCVWLVEKKYFKHVPSYAKAIQIGTLKAAYYYGSAHVIIDNVYGNKATQSNSKTTLSMIKFKLTNWMKKKKNQYVYTTWHGTALKKMGRDQNGLIIHRFDCPNTTMILGDRHTLEIMDHLSFNKVKCKLIGCPRNDMLYCDNEKKKVIKEKLNLPLDKKIILFAPTFRSNADEKDIARSGINQINEMDFNKLFDTLNKRFNGNWVMVCRFHYHVANLINWDELENKYNGTIINGNKSDDMNEYLVSADILISDLSSCLFDFMVTKRPAFSYFPDYDYYANEERGLYYPMDELPFPISKNFDELIGNIENFNDEQFKEKIIKLEKEFDFKFMPNATEKVVEYILKDRNLI